jgi:hypothetical protein
MDAAVTPEVQAIELVPAGGGRALLRVAARWHAAEPRTLRAPALLVDGARVAPLPAPGEGAIAAGPDPAPWRAAYPVADLDGVAYALEAPEAGVFELPAAARRELAPRAVLEDRAQEADARATASSERLGEVESVLVAARAALAEREREIAAAEERRAALEARAVTAEERAAAAEERAASLEASARELQRARAGEGAELERLRAQVSELEQAVAVRLDEALVLGEQLDLARARIAELEARGLALGDEAEELRVALDAIRAPQPAESA